jgi:hypothetical protein
VIEPVRIRYLEVYSAAPVAVVDRFYDWCCSDHATTEVATIQALDSLTTTLDAAELNINLGCIRVGIDMDDGAELALTFLLNVK